MATDEEKIAALKAIRDRTRAAMQSSGDDYAFAICDEEQEKIAREKKKSRIKRKKVQYEAAEGKKAHNKVYDYRRRRGDEEGNDYRRRRGDEEDRR